MEVVRSQTPVMEKVEPGSVVALHMQKSRGEAFGRGDS